MSFLGGDMMYVCVYTWACLLDIQLKQSTVPLNTVPLLFWPFSHHPMPTFPFPPRVHFPSSIRCQEGQPPKSHFNSARHRQRLVDPAASKVSVFCRLGRPMCMTVWSLCGSGVGKCCIQDHTHQWCSSEHLTACPELRQTMVYGRSCFFLACVFSAMGTVKDLCDVTELRVGKRYPVQYRHVASHISVSTSDRAAQSSVS